jgi:prephenate dehydrogenase
VTTVAVIGLGLMGSSFAMALKAARPDVVLVGSDSDPGVVRKAVDRRIVEVAHSDLSMVDIADVVVVAAPIRALRDVFRGLAGKTATKVVTDMASTKVAVMDWASAAGVDLVGGHPMCGKELYGIDAADPSIFRGAPWVITRHDDKVVEMIEAVGSHPIVLSAAKHDRLVAGVSHAAFLLSVGYVLALSGRSDWPEAAEVAGSGFRDMSRLAAGDPELYASVARTNRENMVAMLDAVAAELTRLRRHLEADDPRLVELFEEAHTVREKWAKSIATGAPPPGAASRRRPPPKVGR